MCSLRECQREPIKNIEVKLTQVYSAVINSKVKKSGLVLKLLLQTEESCHFAYWKYFRILFSIIALIKNKQ